MRLQDTCMKLEQQQQQEEEQQEEEVAEVAEVEEEEMLAILSLKAKTKLLQRLQLQRVWQHLWTRQRLQRL